MKPLPQDGALPETETAGDPGLCANCSHVEGCMLRERTSGSILFCEEHEAGGPGMPWPKPVVLADPPAAELSGLCLNCADRDTCTYPKAEGGVWQCEDYR